MRFSDPQRWPLHFLYHLDSIKYNGTYKSGREKQIAFKHREKYNGVDESSIYNSDLALNKASTTRHIQS